MDPITLSVMTGISMAATAAGGAITAMGQMQAGQAAAGMYNYQAQVARQNAEYEKQIGERQAAISGMQTQARLGQIRAAAGGGGLDPNVGSPAEVYRSELALGFMDEGTIRANAARKAYGDVTQADIYDMSAKESKIAGGISATGTLLGTAGSVAGKWVQAGQMGMFGGGAADPGVALYNSGSAMY